MKLLYSYIFLKQPNKKLAYNSYMLFQALNLSYHIYRYCVYSPSNI